MRKRLVKYLKIVERLSACIREASEKIQAPISAMESAGGEVDSVLEEVSIIREGLRRASDLVGDALRILRRGTAATASLGEALWAEGRLYQGAVMEIMRSLEGFGIVRRSGIGIIGGGRLAELEIKLAVCVLEALQNPLLQELRIKYIRSRRLMELLESLNTSQHKS